MRIRIIDAFTDRPYAGNPAGVCLLDTRDWPDENWMRQVAAELNVSETAFAHPLDDGATSWALRWFTPAVEVKLCGHATLATAHALSTDARAIDALSGNPGDPANPGDPGNEKNDTTTANFRFETLSGTLAAHVADDGLITLDLPAAPPIESSVPDGFAEAFGTTPDATYRADQLGDLLAVLPDEAAVRALRPDFRALAGLRRGTGLRGFIATAPAGPDTGYDFVSRFFAPADGIDEDPVTGGAHTVLAPYWSQRFGRTHLIGLQVSARTGIVRTGLRGDRVDLTGRAVTVLDGALHHGPA